METGKVISEKATGAL